MQGHRQQEEHFELVFPQGTTSCRCVKGKLPPWSRLRLEAAEFAAQYDFPNGSHLLRQILNLRPFHIELIQVKSNDPFQFRYRIHKNRLFLFFILKGNVHFTTDKGKHITKASEGNFYISHNQSGLYNTLVYKRGGLGLVISIDPKWAFKIVKNYPHLQQKLIELTNPLLQFSVMPHCSIDNNVKNWLDQLHNLSCRDIKTMRRMLIGYLSLALEYYEDLLIEKDSQDEVRTKAYIDKNFCSPSLTLSKIELHTNTGKRTLQIKFKKEYGVTITEYIIQLRMALAEELLASADTNNTDIWIRVGYRDPNTFEKALKKFRMTNSGNNLHSDIH